MRQLAEIVRSVHRQPRFSGLLATCFVLGMSYSFVVPFMSMWGTLAVKMTPFVFGVFMTITSLSAISLSTFLAHLSDSQVARQTVLTLGGVGGVIGYLGYAFLQNPIALMIVGSLALGLASVCFSQIFAYAREELGRSENSTADVPFLISLLRVFFSLAWTVGPAIGAAVMVRFSYRGIFIAAAALYVAYLVGVRRFVVHRPHHPAARHAPRESLVSVLSRPVILAYFVGFVLLFAAFTMNMMNLPLLVTQQLGGTETQVGIIFGIAPILEMPLMIWFGRLATRGHQVALIRFGVAIGACYFFALTFVEVPWQIYPMQLLSAASIAVTTNIAITFFQDLVPGQTGVATTLYSNSFSVGGLLGYFGFGVLVESVGHRGVFFACAALSVTTLVIILVFRQRPAVAAIPN
jgi:SET family sugar efflux transporter-like MFS transporter